MTAAVTAGVSPSAVSGAVECEPRPSKTVTGARRARSWSPGTAGGGEHRQRQECCEPPVNDASRIVRRCRSATSDVNAGPSGGVAC